MRDVKVSLFLNSCHHLCVILCLQSVLLQTHTQTVLLSLEGDLLAGCPRWLWAACSGGTGTWMNDLKIFLFQMTGVQKWSCKPGLLCLLRSIHWNKKRDMGGGRWGKGRTEIWPNPANIAHPPPSTLETPLMWHHVSVTEQTALLSVAPPDFLLSLFPSSVSLSLSSHPLPVVPNPLPLSSSLLVLFSPTTKGRQSQDWRHPSSL